MTTPSAIRLISYKSECLQMLSTGSTWEADDARALLCLITYVILLAAVLLWTGVIYVPPKTHMLKP